MLIGNYSHTIDAKGRVSIPAKFREELGSQIVVTKGPGECVLVYSLEKFEPLRKSIEALPFTQNKVKHFFLGDAFDVELDKQGRILMPPPLRIYSKLEKDVSVVGMSDHIEIWNSGNWEAEEKDNEENITALLESANI